MDNPGVPVSINIGDVPDSVRDELAARSERSGRSLQEFLKQELIDLASGLDPGSPGSSLSRGKILTHRDSDRLSVIL